MTIRPNFLQQPHTTPDLLVYTPSPFALLLTSLVLLLVFKVKAIPDYSNSTTHSTAWPLLKGKKGKHEGPS